MSRDFFEIVDPQYAVPAKCVDPHFLLCEACGCMMTKCDDPDCERGGDHFDGLCDTCDAATERMED